MQRHVDVSGLRHWCQWLRHGCQSVSLSALSKVAVKPFAAYEPRKVHPDGPAAAVADECLPLYRHLHDRRWLV